MTDAADMPANTPPPGGPGVLIIVGASVAALLLSLAVVFQCLFILPMFEKTLADFKMKVPWFTERVLHDVWWVAPACLAVAVLVCVPRGTRWVGLVLLVLVPLVINLLMLVSLCIPFMELVDGLAGARK